MSGEGTSGLLRSIRHNSPLLPGVMIPGGIRSHADHHAALGGGNDDQVGVATGEATKRRSGR